MNERLKAVEVKVEILERTMNTMNGHLSKLVFIGVGIFAGLVVHLIKELS